MSAHDRTRRVDALGRVVIPADLRRALGIREGDVLDIALDDNRLVLERHEPSCVFCRSRDDLTERSGKHVCARCVRSLAAER